MDFATNWGERGLYSDTAQAPVVSFAVIPHWPLGEAPPRSAPAEVRPQEPSVLSPSSPTARHQRKRWVDEGVGPSVQE